MEPMEVESTSCIIEHWPNEIYITIFKLLNAKDLLACRAVNRIWRINADYCGKYFNKWKTLVRDHMHNRGATYLQKSTLGDLELYLQSLMWKNISTAKVTLKNVFDPKEESKNILKMHVYRDTLIVVYNNCVKFFNLLQNQLTQFKEVQGKYLDYQETEFLVLEATLRKGKKHLSLYCKRNKTKHDMQYIIFTLRENKCHLIGQRGALYLYESTPEKFGGFLLSRYYSDYSQILAVYIYKDDTYVYISKGDIYHHKKGDIGLKLVSKISDHIPIPPGINSGIPNQFQIMFHICSFVYTVENKEDEKIVRSVSNLTGVESLIVFYADLTCAIEHGDILILGFKNGKVGIANVQRMWDTNDMTPVFQFYIQDIAPVKEVEPIRQLDVYEAEDGHHIFVMTSKIYQVVISHASYNFLP